MTSYRSELTIKEIPTNLLLPLALRACGELGWAITYSNSREIIAETPPLPGQADVQVLRIMRQGRGLRLDCSSGEGLVADFGWNKKQAGYFKDKFSELAEQYPGIDLGLELQWLAGNRNRSGSSRHPGSRLYRSLNHWWKPFVPQKDYVLTPLLMDLNILLLLLMVVSSGRTMTLLLPDDQTLQAWGADSRELTIGRHQWWRMITAAFEHVGGIHLLFNMYALYIIGKMLEPLLGIYRYGAAYLAAAVFASVTSLWWHSEGGAVSAGASGAIFGLFGLFLALLTTPVITHPDRKRILKNMGLVILLNLGLGLLPQIDNAGHTGGLVSGILIGYVFYLFNRDWWNRRGQLLMAAALLILTAAVIWLAPGWIGSAK